MAAHVLRFAALASVTIPAVARIAHCHSGVYDAASCAGVCIGANVSCRLPPHDCFCLCTPPPVVNCTSDWVHDAEKRQSEGMDRNTILMVGFGIGFTIIGCFMFVGVLCFLREKSQHAESDEERERNRPHHHRHHKDEEEVEEESGSEE